MNLHVKFLEISQPTFLFCILCFTAILLWTAFASVALPIWLFFKILTALQAAWITYKKLGVILSSSDVPFLHESETNRNYITSCFLIDGHLRVKKLRKRLMARLVRNDHPSYRRLRQRVVHRCGRYVWADEEKFDIKKHLLLYDGDLPTSEQDLTKCINRLTSKPFPEHISPWQFIVIPIKYRKEVSVAIYIRIHHAIGDGFALVGMVSKLVDNKLEFIRPRRMSAIPQNPYRAVLKAVLTGPLALLSVAFSSKAHNPFPTSEKTGDKSVGWSDPIDLEQIKDVKNRTGTTVNDVLASCLAGALRKHLSNQEIDIPKDFPIAISINTRPLKTREREQIPLGNKSTGVFLNLPVSIQDPLKRLRETKRRMDILKSSQLGTVFGFIYQYLIGNLPHFLGRYSSLSLNKHCCLILSNVPGPVTAMEVDGKRVETVAVWPPLVSDMSMSVAIFSYAGHVRVSIIGDKTALPEPAVLLKKYLEDFKELYEATILKKDV